MAESCIFCRIVAGDIPSNRVLDSESVVAFTDVNPQAPEHILIVPRRHVGGLMDLPGGDGTWNALIAAVQTVALDRGLKDGFRVVINQGENGGQTVPHLHLHLLGGRRMSWPPG
jgi:histidine triad (HIT) family protein